MDTQATSNTFVLTFTQCKQIIDNGEDLRDTLENLNDQPRWLTDMGAIDSVSELQAILQGGCESGAYMPAVTYSTALDTMNEHGDDIFEYIKQRMGDLPAPRVGDNWSSTAVYYCSMAVELWCSQFSSTLDGVDWD